MNVLLTGATGSAGSFIIDEFVRARVPVRILVRNRAKASGLEKAPTVQIVEGDMSKPSSLESALDGIDRVLMISAPLMDMVETQNTFIDAAKAAGVHLVFTSIGNANRMTGIPHFDSKYVVEQHIANIGVRATVLAPVYFMENLYFGKEQLAKGIYATPLPPTRRLAQVAVADIGAVAVRLLEDPDRFAGKRFDLGGDELTGNDAMAILSRVTGRPISYYQLPLDVVRQRMGEDLAKMYEWFDRVGYVVDRAALNREFPDVAFHDFESWAKTQDWNALLQSA